MNDDLLVKYLAGEADLHEREAVDSWIGEREDNRRYFNHFRIIWEDSEKLAAESQADENAAWMRFRDNVIRKEPQKSRVRPLAFWLKAAAMVILVCTAGLAGVSLYLNSRSVATLSVHSAGHVVSRTLADGSLVTLNRNSSLVYPSRFNGKSRSVSLKGEAFFNIKPDSNKPFIIRINNITVTVVGTSFNIKSRKGRTEVIVKTGVVQVTRNRDKVEVRAGEKVVAGDKGTLSKEPNAATLYDSYISRTFVCRNTPLPELVAAVNDAYGVQIVIGEEKLEDARINTTLKNQPLEEVLRVLRETLGVQVLREDDKIILK